MSYILEALRRAEAERQRGAVPGLHAQPVAGTLSDAAPGGAGTAHRPWRRPVVALAGVLLAGLLVAAAGLGWLLKPSAALVAVVAPSAKPPVMPLVVPPVMPPVLSSVAPSVLPPVALSPASAAALAAPTARSALPPVDPVAPVAATTPGLPRAPSTARATAPTAGPPATSAPSPVATPAPARSTVAAALTAPVATPATLPAAPAPGNASPGAAPARLPTLAELPEALRREVQPLSLGGAVYAEQPPLRIVIVNGQVFHEGDKPLPELQVQQIRLKSVVFSVRGQRFEMPL